ncbi:late competence protein comea, dna receptor [hydrocarbon metagenome]|uniref:Late competence protein comea, dna receptor n=1 Tax=hydrocarbon metagenome TaxID=938273 RepID=A0A0W8E6I8_9ZZZZ
MLADFDRRWLAVIFILLILAFAAGIRYRAVNESNSSDKEISITDISSTTDLEGQNAEEQEESLIQVYVCGEVENPGIYEVEAGSRLHEVVEMAKAREGAELKYLGMARELMDGETIVVPAVGDSSASMDSLLYASSSSQTGINNGRVNINQASAEELANKLSGIGPVLAQRIIDYRTSHGPFQKIEDLQQVSGIGEKKYDGIKDSICVK